MILLTEIDQQIGKKLRELRLMNGISMTKVAAHLGISYQQVQKYEKGVNKISVGMLLNFLSLLGISIISFFELLDESTQEKSSGESELAIHRRTYELIANYNNIANPDIRGKISELIKIIAK